MQRKLTIMTSKHPSSLLAWLFVMLPILAFFSACSNHKAGDEQKAYALFLEAINHNAAGDKKLAITLIDSALQMNAADTTRSWLTCEKTTALVDLGKLQKGETDTVIYSEYDEQFQAVGNLVILLLILDICMLEVKNPLLRNVKFFTH